MPVATLKTGLSTTARMRADAIENIVALVNGSDSNLYFHPDQATTLNQLGGAAPTVGTFAAADGAAGSVDAGVHFLLVLYRNSTTKNVSAVSASISYTAAGSKKVDLTNIPVPSDSQFDKKDVYMTTAGAGTGGTYYFLGEVAAASATATFDSTDAALAGQNSIDTADRTDGGDPLKAKFVLSKWNRLILFYLYESSTPFPNDYAWSLQLGESPAGYLEPSMFPGVSRDKVSRDDGDSITAVNGDFAHAAAIFRRNSIYFLTQETVDDPLDPDNQFFRIRHIPTNGVGCIAENAQNGTIAVNFGGHRIFFPWYDGIWMLGEDGSIEKVSQDIQDTWDAIEPTMLAKIEMGYDPKKRVLLVACATAGKTVNDQQLRFDLVRKTWHVDNGLAPQVYAGVEESGGESRTYFGDPYGFVNLLFEGTYDGGVSTGTLSGLVESGTGSTITDTTAAFEIAGSALRGVPVMVKTPAGVKQYRFIASNTATVLTIDTANGFGSFSPVPGADDTYAIGYIGLRAKTAKHHHGTLDEQKLFMYATVFSELQDDGDLEFNVYLDGDSTAVKSETIDMTDKEFHRVPLYPDDAGTKNKGFYQEYEFIQEGVNQPTKIRNLTIDAIPTREV